jgi:hypothetical protein
LRLSLLVGLALCISRPHDANGQVRSLNSDEVGVRHALTAAVEADPDAGADMGGSEQPGNAQELGATTKERTATAEAPRATIHVLLRILDYAPDSRFYGVVDAEFSDFELGTGAPAREIWADRKCHRHRGFPRIWVSAINGRITRGKTVFDVGARPRHIGEWLPTDEIIMQKDPQTNHGNPAQRLVIQARTTQSRVNVTLTLTSTKCRHGED